MRVAQRMVSRNYMKTMNTSLTRRAESLERSTSGLKFQKLSDNVGDGTRAMQLQEFRYQSSYQLNNVENLLLEMNAADSNLDSMDDTLQTMAAKVLEGMHEGYGQTKRDILAQEISKQKEQILQLANAQFGSDYLFSGTNNTGAPFTEGANGKLMFNGVQVDQISKKNGKYVFTDAADGVEKEVPMSGDVFIDIGIGMKIDSKGEMDPRTAFQSNVNGLQVMGFGEGKVGEDGNRVSGNLYDLLTQIEGALKNYETSTPEGALDDMHTQLVDLTDSMRLARTDLGSRMNYMERTKTRLDNEIDNLGEMESKLVSADPAEEAINMKQCEYVWLSVLQLGAKILPTSLLDYMR